MTDSELLAAIDADPTTKALADAGNDAGCAARLNDRSGPLAGPVNRASLPCDVDISR